jgi:hypothetical protein
MKDFFGLNTKAKVVLKYWVQVAKDVPAARSLLELCQCMLNILQCQVLHLPRIELEDANVEAEVSNLSKRLHETAYMKVKSPVDVVKKMVVLVRRFAALMCEDLIMYTGLSLEHTTEEEWAALPQRQEITHSLKRSQVSFVALLQAGFLLSSSVRNDHHLALWNQLVGLNKKRRLQTGRRVCRLERALRSTTIRFKLDESTLTVEGSSSTSEMHSSICRLVRT